eukprot:s5068_g9.t1
MGPSTTRQSSSTLALLALAQCMSSRGFASAPDAARNHSENLLLAASALSWAVCQVLYWDMPVQRAVAELMVCQNERWEQMPRCRQRYRRRVIRESWTLLKQVLYPARTAFDIDLLLNEEVYSRLLGEFELVNANIEFGHPFQAALAQEALLPLSDALRRAGVWQAVAKADVHFSFHFPNTRNPSMEPHQELVRRECTTKLFVFLSAASFAHRDIQDVSMLPSYLTARCSCTAVVESSREKRLRVSSDHTFHTHPCAFLVGGAIRVTAVAAVGRKLSRHGGARTRLLAASQFIKGANDVTEEPLFCTVLSTQEDWRAAVAEVTAEASYQLRSRPRKCWDFGVVYVSGHHDVSVTDITMTLDRNLGTSGACIGAAVNGCGGPGTDHHRRTHTGRKTPVMQLIAVQQPHKANPSASNSSPAELAGAKPFFVGQRELQEISGLVCQIQGRTRVIGAQEPPLPRAWREYLGIDEKEEARPRGILLFIDPLASKYVVGTVLSALDLALPNAVKCGAVCADLLPSRRRVAVAGYEMRRGISSADDVPAGVAGLLLPPDMSIHSMVCSGSSRVGPELRVTSADGQVIKMMQSEDDIEAHPATEMLEAVCKQASPVQQLLIEKGGYLLGLEAPRDPLDPDKSKVYDDVWGSSERAPSYSSLRRQAAACDWLVRSLEPLPGGSVVIRRENLKRIPPRVGPAWVRCQVHVFDERQGRQELQLMLQRYMGARMTLPTPAGKPFGAMIFTCRSWFAQAEDEVGVAEVSAAFDPPPTVVSVNVCGEVAHPGIALGGVDQKRTTIQGHTATCCFLSYEPSHELSTRGHGFEGHRSGPFRDECRKRKGVGDKYEHVEARRAPSGSCDGCFWGFVSQATQFGADGFGIDQNALKRHEAEQKVKCARYLRFAFCAHAVVLILINIIVWAIWFILRSKQKGGTYQWPLWVTLGSVVLLVAHLLSMLPYAVCKPSHNCPRWVWVILLNIALVNIVCWGVYATAEQQACPINNPHCEYLWPAWVSGATVLGGIVVSLLPCLIGAIFGIHDDVGDREAEGMMYSSESD